APARRFGGHRFGDGGAGDLRRRRLLWPPRGRPRHALARLGWRFGGPAWRLRRRGPRHRGPAAQNPGRARPVPLPPHFPPATPARTPARGGPAARRRRGPPPAPPSAGPPPALAGAMRLSMRVFRPFGAAAVAGLLRVARSSVVMLGRRRSKVCGLPGRELVA